MVGQARRAGASLGSATEAPGTTDAAPRSAGSSGSARHARSRLTSPPSGGPGPSAASRAGGAVAPGTPAGPGGCGARRSGGAVTSLPTSAAGVAVAAGPALATAAPGHQQRRGARAEHLGGASSACPVVGTPGGAAGLPGAAGVDGERLPGRNADVLAHLAAQAAQAPAPLGPPGVDQHAGNSGGHGKALLSSRAGERPGNRVGGAGGADVKGGLHRGPARGRGDKGHLGGRGHSHRAGPGEYRRDHLGRATRSGRARAARARRQLDTRCGWIARTAQGRDAEAPARARDLVRKCSRGRLTRDGGASGERHRHQRRPGWRVGDDHPGAARAWRHQGRRGAVPVQDAGPGDVQHPVPAGLEDAAAAVGRHRHHLHRARRGHLDRRRGRAGARDHDLEPHRAREGAYLVQHQVQFRRGRGVPRPEQAHRHHAGGGQDQQGRGEHPGGAPRDPGEDHVRPWRSGRTGGWRWPPRCRPPPGTPTGSGSSPWPRLWPSR